MKIQELRQGNYTLDQNGKLRVICPVDLINYEMHKVGGPNEPDGVKKMQINPIPITDAWLIKLGFSEMNIHPGYYYKPLTIDDEITLESEDFLFHLKTGYVQMDFMDVISSVGIPIIYVHQLQNIYYALTGEELTTKS